MNKTVNINLAGVFFHIDEDAYTKLQHYLEAIKRSFTNTPGNDEIIADIEARIAELFTEKIRDKRQVVSLKEVEEVIAIMGQPEDYMVDEEIFEDEPEYESSTRKTIKGRKLFRDTQHSYIGGVSSGLGHYLEIEAIWIRLLWVFLTFLTSGAFILIYIAMWIFVPEAKTTADRLAMEGEEVTISNIEKKIREGFDNVTGKMKDVDYQKYGDKARSGASSAGSAIGNIIKVLLNVFVKFIGIILLLFAGVILIGLFIGLFTVGIFGLIDTPWIDYVEMAVSGGPFWLISIIAFFLAAIPCFFLFILGLKILVPNLRSIGRTAKLVLLGLWIISFIGAVVITIQQATNTAFDGETVVSQSLNINKQDTLFVSMRNTNNFSSSFYRGGDFKIRHDENGQKMLFSDRVWLSIKSTRDSLARIEILKSAEGRDFEDANLRAQNINYDMSLQGNELQLDSYLTSDLENKFRNQEVEISLYVPEGATLYVDSGASAYVSRYESDNIFRRADQERFLEVIDGATICHNCPVEQTDFNDETNSEEWESDEWNEEDDYNAKVNINRDGVDIQIQKNSANNTPNVQSANAEEEDTTTTDSIQ
ncbi:PspC domain-containing protein [Zunongwangia sp. F363]|uniref:PspC domain-containing protein n=1 Tax=Autumnicola tepida TaxID=3075595 RepID=A0ABU3CEE2_9FLAO|nr:PspC domain-containing protein [Zunongwangia sp. F363]MDT0644722.1 PspC domain-containing protein [Zunongwangia sp. F363]